MKVLIVTAAGMAKRFNESLSVTGNSCDVIKCLYSDGDPKETLLYRLLQDFCDVDKVIIVGGYKYKKLKNTIDIEPSFSEFRDRIVLINNENYEEYGSGFSLLKGLRAAINMNPDEIIFSEGDLFLDSGSCRRICDSDKNILTINKEAIYADKAVIMYMDENNGIHYIYDTSHGKLQINETFIAIFNSGQVWKFKNISRIKSVIDRLDKHDWYGTNLVFVEKYFNGLESSEYEIVEFEHWINCNTVEDYNRVFELEASDEDNKRKA